MSEYEGYGEPEFQAEDSEPPRAATTEMVAFAAMFDAGFVQSNTERLPENIATALRSYGLQQFIGSDDYIRRNKLDVTICAVLGACCGEIRASIMTQSELRAFDATLINIREKVFSQLKVDSTSKAVFDSCSVADVLE
jgi:hypothetical protein